MPGQLSIGLIAAFGCVALAPVSTWADNQVGNSSALVYERLLQAINDNGGSLPFPPDKLLAKILPGAKLTYGDVPYGRSPVGSSTNADHSRYLVEKAPYFFLAYTPSEKKIEILAYDSKERVLQPIEATGYQAGARAQAVTPKREECTNCHQNGGPILSISPWAEFNNGCSAAVKALNGVAKDSGLPSLSSHEAGLRKHFPGASCNVDVYDVAVRLTGPFLQKVQSCNEICGNDIACRSMILEAAVLPASETIEKPDFRKSLQTAIEPHWPASGFAYPTSNLPDREAHGKGGLTGKAFFPGKSVKDTYDEDLALRNARLSNHDEDGFDAVSGSAADPRTARPLVHEVPKEQGAEFIASASTTCLGLSDEDQSLLAKFSPEQLRSAIAQPAVQELLSQWPPDRPALMSRLFGTLQAASAVVCWQGAKDALDPRTQFSQGITTMALHAAAHVQPNSLSTPERRFQHFCYECHRSGSYPVFKGGLAGAQGKRSLICGRLNDMPPAYAKNPLSPDIRMLMKEDMGCPGR